MKTLAMILSVAGLSAAAVPPVQAHNVRPDGMQKTSIEVRYGDLDLETAEGEQAFQNRVARAVRQACRVTRLENGLRAMNRDARNCLSKARVSAARQVAAVLDKERRGG